jgi:mono/diheme cytochrome c family protein
MSIVTLRGAILFISLVCSAGGVSRSVWDGVYSKAQVQRGQNVYREECAKCHGENLTGGEGAPALVGSEFLKKWQGKTAGDLFEAIRKTMPSDDPGNLSRRQYADIVAYMLNANEFPAGEKELDSTSAALNEIRIELKR